MYNVHILARFIVNFLGFNLTLDFQTLGEAKLVILFHISTIVKVSLLTNIIIRSLDTVVEGYQFHIGASCGKPRIVGPEVFTT